MKYHYRPIRMAKIQKLTIPIADKDKEQQERAFVPGQNKKWYNHSRRQFGSFLQS